MPYELFLALRYLRMRRGRRVARGCGHCWRTASCIEFFTTSVRICFSSAGGNAFASNCDKHNGIIWLIAERTRFAILDPEIGPVVVNLECERGSGDCDVTPEIFCDIESGFLFA